MGKKRVVPGSLTKAYKDREGDFSPDLVGQQFTEGSSLLTLGNFGITTNLEPKQNRVFDTGKYSEQYTLETLNLTQEESIDLSSNNVNTTLNLDITDVSKYVYYGSFVELLRVTVESIITSWKGSLYVTDEEGGITYTTKNTVLSYNYDDVTNKSTFQIPTQFVRNDFELIHNDLGGVQLSYKDITNIKLNQDKYEISNDFGQFPIIGYTGDTENTNPYITVQVEGESFPTLSATTLGTFRYHLKPKDTVVDRLFFGELDEFSNVLMNRLTLPKYTATFDAPIETESGKIFNTRKRFTWPTTDGFNIDVQGSKYASYISNLLDFASAFDRASANLITRKYVSGSITEFDTDSNGIGDTGKGRKVNKLLNIYGREFDEIKKYTDGLAFANTVTYDKKDNTPDELIKNMARTLGFDTINSITDNELLSYITSTNQATFSGESRELSVKEVDTELWRRLVINAWWLFRSKGTRKVIEFYIKLFGLSDCLINFDEYVYLVKDKIDVDSTFDTVREILGRRQGIDPSLITIDEDDYPVDENGFPRILPNTEDYYFQMDGFWYNAGTEHSKGNNPHNGPYDFGSKYFEKFTSFVDDFSVDDTITEVEVTEVINLFSDYNEGTVEVNPDGGKPVTDFGTNYGTQMLNNSRFSSNVTVAQAGFNTTNSRTGDGSFLTRINLSDESCELNTGGLQNCPLFEMDRGTGIVLTLGAKNNASPDGRINVEGSVLSKECCELYGYEWDTSETPSVFSSEGKILNDTFSKSVDSLFNNFSVNNTSNFCYWCPQVQAICDYQQYIEILLKQEGVPGFVDFGILEGFYTSNERNSKITELSDNTQVLQSNISTFVETLITKYGNKGFCRLTQTDFEPVKKDCCLIRGGKWVDINEATSVNEQEWRCVMDIVDVGGDDPNPTFDEVIFKQNTTTRCGTSNVVRTSIHNPDGTNVSEEFCNYWSTRVNESPTFNNTDVDENLTSSDIINQNYYTFNYDSDGVCRHLRTLKNNIDKVYTDLPSFTYLMYENRSGFLEQGEITSMEQSVGTTNITQELINLGGFLDDDYYSYNFYPIPLEDFESRIRVEVDKIILNGYEYPTIEGVSTSRNSIKEYIGRGYTTTTQGGGPGTIITNYDPIRVWDIIEEVLVSNDIAEIQIKKGPCRAGNNTNDFCYRLDSSLNSSFRIEGQLKNHNTNRNPVGQPIRFYVEKNQNGDFDMGTVVNGNDQSVMRPEFTYSNTRVYTGTSSSGSNCDDRWDSIDGRDPIDRPPLDAIGVQTASDPERNNPRGGQEVATRLT